MTPIQKWFQMMENQTTKYHAYLLRYWQEGEATSWRATLEDPHNGEIIGFSTLQHLCAFLEKHTNGKPSKQDQTNSNG